MFWNKTANRRIFVYHDGTKKRKVDPLPIWRELWSHPRNLESALKIRQDDGDHMQSQWRDEAFADIVAVVRDVFKIKPYDGETGKGLTEDETEGVFAQYAMFMQGLKKKQGMTPSESQSSESSTLEKSTTPPESGSCSMKESSKSEEPESISTQ